MPDCSVCLHLSSSNSHIKYYVPLNLLRQHYYPIGEHADSKSICDQSP